MRVLIALAAVAAVLLQSASATGGEEQGSKHGEGQEGQGGGQGDQDGEPEGVGFVLHGCTCPATQSSTGHKHVGGPCGLNYNGTQLTGCEYSNKYVQCVNTTCTALTCPAQTLWNQTDKSCNPCLTGYHVNAANTSCVCDKGTTRTRVEPTPAGQEPTYTCGPCPTGSVETPDACFCNNTANFLLNKTANACVSCPDDTNVPKFATTCQCNNQSLYWNESTGSCVNCPGQLTIRKNRRGEVIEKMCTCTGTNQFFVAQTVSCYACPQGSTASESGQSCNCPRRMTFRFQGGVGACVCRGDLVPDSTGTTCIAPTTAAAPAA